MKEFITNRNMTPDLKEALIDEYIKRSFRDIADQDYITARICYRYDLKHSFLWSSLQALEKYLKAIHLFNRKSIKAFYHNIEMAYSGLSSIDGIPFEFPPDVEDFIKYLNEEGLNRYFEYPYVTHGKELLYLDMTVWYIRRYCHNLKRKAQNISGNSEDNFQIELQIIHNPIYLKYPNKYKLFDGYLENVLKKKNSKLRENLIWKNFYFGTYKKHVIKKYTFRSSSGNPVNYLYPEVFNDLSRLIKFSRPVTDYFARLTSENDQF